ncbi:MAG: copper amine oxidase N-terminal domain-containing protein [Clostridia bacterium]|nr:copper amine oxidase N-terminal domain-containing protein [Clostridia bacterium]
MKKFLIFLFLFLLIFCRSSANNQDIIESNSVQVIVNGKKNELTSPVLFTNDSLLFPLRNLLQLLPSSGVEIFWEEKEKQVMLLAENSTLTFQIDSDTALLNDTPFTLSATPILYKNQTFIPLRIVSEFLDCRIAWDNPSKSVFIKSFSDFYESEAIFRQSTAALKKVSSVKMDVINEITNPQGSFSFGHSIYVDKNANTIYTKNVLNSDWNLSAENVLSNSPEYEEQLLPFCFSLDKTKSNENTYVLTGFYPSKKGTLNESSLFIDTTNLQVVKLTTKTDFQVQNVLYQYEVRL